MTKLIATLILTLLFFTIFGQISIDHDDMPQSGDTIRHSTTLNAGGLNFEQSGANFTWDFSTLNPLAQRVDSFVSVQQTPWVYQLLFFGAANLAQPMQEFDQLPGFAVTDVYNFMKNTDSDFRMVGYGVTMNGIPIPTKFDQPDKVYQFPVEWGGVDSSLSSYEINLPGIGYSGGWKKRVNSADGWGTLITPYGTFETLRIRAEIKQYDSIYIDSLNIGFPVLRQYSEFKWLGKNFGLPLCQVVKEGMVTNITYIDSARVISLLQEEQIFENKRLAIYPNPATNIIHVKLDDPNQKVFALNIYDVRGRNLVSLNSSLPGKRSNDFSFSVADAGLKSGLYLLSIITADSIITEKFLIR